ncbi:MAG: bifunctional 5,10-methylenetetrahydrofolate dehydrogenase/5,10-methenyltetrahydrofolate cyclohydrolase [Acidobacteriota bacterium]
MTTILDGHAIAATMRAEVKEAVDAMIANGARPPSLTAVLVGDNPASSTYVASKTKACKNAGLIGETLRLPADVSHETLDRHLRALAANDEVDGILVQLPLPDHLPTRTVLETVPPEKDVDGFHAESVGRLWLGEPGLTPATPTGVIELLKRYDIALSGAHAVIVGRSDIVGKPMAALLLRENCTVTICHSRTRDLPAMCRQADLLVAAIGRPAMIGPEHVREGAVVVDVGINRITDAATVEKLYPGNEKRRRGFDKRGSTLTGDVDYERVAPLASAITPVPRGVGPLTVAQLLVNTLTASKRRQGLA